MNAGAEFIQTQLCFDVGVVRRYVAHLGEFGMSRNVRMLIGIGPLGSAAAPRWMRENLPGAIVPDAVVRRMEGAAEPKREGRQICVELMAGTARGSGDRRRPSDGPAKRGRGAARDRGFGRVVRPDTGLRRGHVTPGTASTAKAAGTRDPRHSLTIRGMKWGRAAP